MVMDKPTDPEKIQLIAVLRVLCKSQDAVASMLKLSKTTVGKTEEWIKTENIQEVWDIFDDVVLQNTIVRELRFLEEVSNDDISMAYQIGRRVIFLHYGRKPLEDNWEKALDDHKNDLAECAKELVKRLKQYSQDWDDKDLKIHEILVDEDDFGGIEYFSKKITNGLLRHLAEYDKYFSELKALHDWTDFSIGDINENLLNLISLRAALRDFSGKCEICEKLIPK